MRKFAFLCLVILASLPVVAQQSPATTPAQSQPADQKSKGTRGGDAGIGTILGTTAPPPQILTRALPADAPTRDQVMTLLELLQVRKNMAAVMGSMKQIMRDAAEQSFRERVPNPTPKQLAALHGMFDDIIDAMSVDDLISAIIPIYQRHLTKTDIEELIRFYSSPVGQKLLREQPQIIQESMQAGVAVQQARMDEIKAKIAQRAQEMREASEDAIPAPRK
jgi:hypothetical protein